MSSRRGFRLLWSSTAASNLADGMALVLLPLVALDGGADAAGVALVTVALSAAWPLLGLQAGWIVDRFPKRVIIGTGNAARGGAFAALAVWSASGTAPLWFIVAVAAVYGIGETLVDTGINSSVPTLVEPAGRTSANSRIEAAITITNSLAGRPLAGFLVGLGFGLALGSVALLYLMAAVLAAAIVALSSSRRANASPEEVLPVRLRDGILALWRHPVLRSLTILTAVSNLSWAMWEALFIVYAVRPGPLGLTPLEFGLVLSLAALGGIAASVATPWLTRRVPTRTLLGVDMLGTVLLVLPVALGAPLWVTVGGVVVASAGSTLWRIVVSTYRQQEIEERLLGRVYSAYRVISWGSIPVGAAVAAGVAALSGLTGVFWVASAIALAGVVLFVALMARRPLQLRG